MPFTMFMRSGDTLLINGAELTFENRAKVRIENKSRFMFGNQVLPEHLAVTPARKLYFAIQRAYTGDAKNIERDSQEALVRLYGTEGFADQKVRLEPLLRSCDYFPALRVVQEMINLEDAKGTENVAA